MQPVPTRHRKQLYQNADSSLRKHEDLTQCCFNIGPAPLVGGANIETALGQILVFAGLNTGVCLQPPLPSIIFSPADQGIFSKTAGQSQAYYNTWNWEWGTYDVTHLQILTCEVAVSRTSSVPDIVHEIGRDDFLDQWCAWDLVQPHWNCTVSMSCVCRPCWYIQRCAWPRCCVCD